jgi:hypothetical protein
MLQTTQDKTTKRHYSNRPARCAACVEKRQKLCLHNFTPAELRHSAYLTPLEDKLAQEEADHYYAHEHDPDPPLFDEWIKLPEVQAKIQRLLAKSNEPPTPYMKRLLAIEALDKAARG